MLKLCLGLLLLAAAVVAGADDYDSLRAKWLVSLTGTNYNTGDSLVASGLALINNTAQSWWNMMNTNSSRTYLWSDLTSSTDSAQITTAYGRLEAMALACATYGCALYHNAALAADIQGGLDWLHANRYYPRVEYGNWWDWEIGTPLQIADISVLMYDTLSLAGLSSSLDAVEHFDPSPTSHGYPGTFTGANLADRIRIVAVRGTVVKDAGKLAAARDALSNLFPYVTSGDGFYADGSFIQHSYHPYNGSYGRVLLDDLSALLPWLKGSPWECTDPAQTNVVNWVYDSYEPFIYLGAMMDMTRGRSISRSSQQDHVAGHWIAEDVLALSPFASSADAGRMRNMVKYWMQADAFRSFNDEPFPLIPAFEQLAADSTAAPRGELVGHWTFRSMDQAVHRRPGWCVAVSMSSSRIANYESMNGENLHGWFAGAGMTWLYSSKDQGQFSDNFWPTVDPYHLPGTTVEQATLANGAGQTYRNSKNWVGGVTLLTNGVAGMDIQNYGSPLSGKKSWFMFDDEVVCLGAGISCGGSTEVHTTVEDRKVSNNIFVLDGKGMPATPGWSINPASVTWCELGSAGGYYFPGGTTNVSVSRQTRTGSWSQINTGGSTASYSRDYLSVCFNHGAHPQNAAYAYVLLPNFDPLSTSIYAAHPEVVILENSTNVQAVKETTLNVVAANFWNDATNTVDFIACNAKASVLTQETPSSLWVALADPTQTNTGDIVLTLNRSVAGVVSADSGITVNQLSPVVKMTVNVNQARGRSFVAKFTYSGYAPVITNAPTSQTVGAGQNVTLKVGAGGATPLSYRWEFNQSDITGATNSSYTITNLQSAGAGWYSVVVSNAYGSVASPPMFLSVTMSLTNASGSIVSPPGLVDWWPADGNLLDIFGEVSGTPQSGFSFVPGESGQAFHFNGSAGCVVLGATNLPPPWTFCCWVNRQNAPGASAALIADGSYSLKLEQYNSTRQAGLTHLGVGDYFFSPPCTVPAGTWTHLAFVGTGTNVDLYLNGSLSGSISVANFPLPRSFIGAAEASGVKIDYLLGSLDEILVFNRALAGAEIGAIYSAGSAGLCRAPEFSGIGKDDAGNIQLNLRGQTGKSFTLYTSTNLLNWASAGVIENPVGVVQCTNSVDGQPQEFFRASQP